MLNILNKNINLISFLFYFLIFTYVYIFSLNNIINLWTFNELHINYSAGFLPRGLIGTIMLKLDTLGFEKRIFFSSLFYIFTILNFLLFLNILKIKFKNVLIFIFFVLNPSFILFSFYDLGGYARLEIFGIFSILLHTYLALIADRQNEKLIFYNKYYFFLIIPILIANVLIHEVNFFLIPFHIILTWLIINQTSIYEKIKYYFPYLIFIPIALYFWFNPITAEKALLIFDQIENKQNINASIIESIGMPILFRSEFSYMINPLTNLFKYFFIFLFYLTPVLIMFHWVDRFTKRKIFLNILVILPLFLLFYIGRDWGRWIHIILFVVFCINIYLINKRNNLIYKNKILVLFFTMLILFQFTFTRIPHCCNLVEKNISITGGIISKVIVFNNLINNKIDVKSRFKSF
tara:strand:- start:32 stop:1249 length:1218 start_codon:yes stop_codon:yes gene_type:complete